MANANSEWTWSPEHQDYYCYRLNESGISECRWSSQTNSGAVSHQPSTPTAQSSAQTAYYQQGSPSTTYSSSDTHSSSPTQPRTIGQYDAQPSSYPQNPSTATSGYGGSYSTGTINNTQGPYTQQSQYTTDPQTATAASTQPSYYSTAATYSTESNQPEQTQTQTQTTQASNSAVPGYIGQSSAANLVSKDPLDKRYKRIKRESQKRFFVTGRVFKTLWVEPAGHSGTTSAFTTIRFNEQAFAEIRRFIVIKNKGVHSTCIAISTYSRQGTTKQGVDPDHHALVYNAGRAIPGLLSGEFLKKVAIPIVDSEEGEVLQPESRVCFEKPYTVEHNAVKIWDLGYVHEQYIPHLKSYYQECNG